MKISTDVAIAFVKCIQQYAELTDNQADDVCFTQKSTVLNIMVLMETG